MVEKSQLKNLLAMLEYSRLDKILICLACDVNAPKEVKTIRQLAVSSGLRPASKWNVSQILKGSPGLAIRVPQGWELSQAGKKRVSELVGPFAASPAPIIASTLRQHIPSLSNNDTDMVDSCQEKK